MPLYEYQCASCGAVFEELVRAAASLESMACPACGAPNAQRLLSAPSLGAAEGEGLAAGSGCVPRGGFT